MAKPKILLITYYWPPAGGVAVLRWLYFTYFFASRGYSVTVLHPKSASYPQVDFDLSRWIHPACNTISAPIIEPEGVYKTLRKKSSSNTEVFQDSNSWWKKLSLYIRANYFIPDARMLWISSAKKVAKDYIQKNNIDLLITNGTPHSCHVVGLQLKRELPNLTWLADFRDPWLEIDYFKDLPLTKKARNKHQQLEQQVLSTADLVTTVSPSWQKLFQRKGAKQTAVFTNGFLQADFTTKQEESKNETFTIRHIGTVTADRNPINLWEALRGTNQDVKVEFYGPVDGSVVAAAAGLSQVSFYASVPHHRAIDLMQTSHALLLLNNQVGDVTGRIPAKVFEYMATRKPILYIGSYTNDAYRILDDVYQEGLSAFRYQDSIDVKNLLTHKQVALSTSIDQFSREQIAEAFALRIETLFQ